MSELPEKKDKLQQLSITALKFEIESKGVYKMQPEFSKDLKDIKSSINFLEKHGTERSASLHDDISNWEIFIRKVDGMLEYLESKDIVLVETQPKDSIEMEQRRLFLEVYCNLVDYYPYFEYFTELTKFFSVTFNKVQVKHGSF